MTALTLDTHVGQLAADRPSRAPLFERLGIDYCCGGQLALRDACAGKGLDPEAVLRELASHDQTAPAGNETDWASAPLAALADLIVATYHNPLREDLPRLALLIDKVARPRRTPSRVDAAAGRVRVVPGRSGAAHAEGRTGAVPAHPPA